MADISNPNKPQGDLKDPVAEQGTAGEPHKEPTFEVRASVGPTNTQIDNPGTTETEEQRRQRWKDRREWAAFLLSIAAFVVSFGSCYGSNRSADTAERALKTTIENFQLDQRAWVGPRAFAAPSEIREGEGMSFTIEFFNSGKTPALRLRVIGNALTLPKGDPFVPVYHETTEGIRKSVTELPPETATDLSGPLKMTAVQAEAIRTGKNTLYFYGEMSYTAKHVGVHCRMFCSSLSPDLKNTSPCATHDETKDTKCENIKW